MARLDDLHAKLAASLNSEGKPAKGYKLRVAAIRAEIARQEALQPERGALTAGSNLP